MIENPPYGSLTQCVIFSCAVAEDYVDCIVHGMVITARCDVENDKTPVYNYIPVVKFDDWLLRDGARVLAHRVLKASFGDMKSCLKALDFAPSILDTMPHAVILETIFRASGVTAKVAKQAPNFERASVRHAVARECLDGLLTIEDTHKLLTTEKSDVDRIIQELCQNAIAEAYFISGVERGDLGTGYVALLREVRHVPRSLANAIAQGLDKPSYIQFCDANPNGIGRLSIPDDGFCWPTGIMASPFAEHLLQRWSLLFSRIGVTDVEVETVRGLQGRIASNSGGKGNV